MCSDILIWVFLDFVLSDIISLHYSERLNSYLTCILNLWLFFKWQINDFVILILRSLYTSLPHDYIKAKVFSLVVWCFNRESNKYLGTSNKAGFFSNKKYYSYKSLACAEFCEAFTILIENICAIWRHGLSTNSGNFYGHKLWSTHSGFIFIFLL